MTETIRYTEVNFNDISFEVEFEDGESEEAVIKRAHQMLIQNFTELIQDQIEVRVLPITVLTPETVFIGKIVKTLSNNQNGMVLKINRQNQRAVTVLFTDGSTQIFDYHELIQGNAEPHIFKHLIKPYHKGAPIEGNRIYPIATNTQSGLAIVTINRNRKYRATIHFLTNLYEPAKEYMEVEQIKNFIID